MKKQKKQAIAGTPKSSHGGSASDSATSLKKVKSLPSPRMKFSKERTVNFYTSFSPRSREALERFAKEAGTTQRDWLDRHLIYLAKNHSLAFLQIEELNAKA